jgi:thioredoxin-related protein
LHEIEYQETAMLSRRSALVGSVACLAAWPMPPAHAAAILTDDGIYTQPWFLESFLELRDDLEAAAKGGKRFAIMWELRGCPYCRQTHLVNFAQPEIESFIRERFEILQLNILGAREVTDFDGEKLPEKAFAAKYGVRYTPTVQFFPEQAGGRAAKKAPREREVARFQGYLKPDRFLAAFRFVADKSYERGTLDNYLKTSG